MRPSGRVISGVVLMGLLYVDLLLERMILQPKFHHTVSRI